MSRLVTSSQFLNGIFSVLRLDDRTHFALSDTDLDKKFEGAFEDLVANEVNLGIKVNFSFYLDPLHGDSLALRDGLLAAKENDVISINNPTYRTFDIKLDEERAQRYLNRSPVPPDFLRQVVEKHFGS